jgi:hypothetical protein
MALTKYTTAVMLVPEQRAHNDKKSGKAAEARRKTPAGAMREEAVAGPVKRVYPGTESGEAGSMSVWGLQRALSSVEAPVAAARARRPAGFAQSR